MSVATSDVKETDLKVFPNPFNEYIEIHPGDGQNAVQVRLTDIHGVLVTNLELTCPCRIHLPDLLPGVYLYSITMEDSTVRTGRIVKVK
jgi:hypothetical protein